MRFHESYWNNYIDREHDVRKCCFDLKAIIDTNKTVWEQSFLPTSWLLSHKFPQSVMKRRTLNLSAGILFSQTVLRIAVVLASIQDTGSIITLQNVS